MITVENIGFKADMANTNTKVVTAHVSIPLAEKVDQLATWMERSRGWIVKQALSAWVDQEEERHQLTLEALEDVGGGNVIDHQVVQAWADSLNTDRLDAFDSREVCRFLVGQYEMRYEIQNATIYILRLWHTREGK